MAIRLGCLCLSILLPPYISIYAGDFQQEELYNEIKTKNKVKVQNMENSFSDARTSEIFTTASHKLLKSNFLPALQTVLDNSANGIFNENFRKMFPAWLPRGCQHEGKACYRHFPTPFQCFRNIEQFGKK